jgi:hypothetical protein
MYSAQGVLWSQGVKALRVIYIKCLISAETQCKKKEKGKKKEKRKKPCIFVQKVFKVILTYLLYLCLGVGLSATRLSRLLVIPKAPDPLASGH